MPLTDLMAALVMAFTLNPKVFSLTLLAVVGCPLGLGLAWLSTRIKSPVLRATLEMLAGLAILGVGWPMIYVIDAFPSAGLTLFFAELVVMGITIAAVTRITRSLGN